MPKSKPDQENKMDELKVKFKEWHKEEYGYDITDNKIIQDHTLYCMFTAFKGAWNTRTPDLEAENKKLREAFGMDQPWPLMDVIKKLSFATDILLHRYDYDDDGWEEVQEAHKLAATYWIKIHEALKDGE